MCVRLPSERATPATRSERLLPSSTLSDPVARPGHAGRRISGLLRANGDGPSMSSDVFGLGVLDRRFDDLQIAKSRVTLVGPNWFLKT